MTIKNSLTKAASSLKKTSSSPSLDAEVLLSFVLKLPKEKLLSNLDYVITPSEQKRYLKLIQRRKKNEPIAYIINNKEFFGLDFYVDKRVLIPRPETEIIVEEALAITQIIKRNKQVSIVDVGTGSGCIATSIARNYTNSKIFAIDKSKDALRVAKKNIEKHKCKSKIKLMHGNLLRPLQNKVDIIVANLPYLTLEQINATEKSVREYEPKMALLAGKTETYLYELLISQASKYLNKKGYILLEIDPLFSTQTKKLVKQYFPNSKISIIKDLSKKDRVLKVII